MSCSSFELRDYVLGELSGSDARAVESHVAGCAACGDEVERLRLTRGMLLAVREEEMPRRIAFVSDKVFEPRWWHRLFQPGGRLAFASAAMLSAALLVHAFARPAPAAAPQTADAAMIEARVNEELARRLPALVQQVVGEAERRSKETAVKLVADTEQRFEFQRRADLVTVEENVGVLTRRVDRIYGELNSRAGNTAVGEAQ